MPIEREKSKIVSLSSIQNDNKIIFMPLRDGTVLYAKNIMKALGENFEFYGIRPNSKMTTSTITTTIESLAKEFALEIVTHFSTDRIYLFGLSFGGLLAFETGREIEKLGKKIEKVWIGDTDIERHLPIYMLLIRRPLREITQGLRFLKYNFKSWLTFYRTDNFVRSYRFRYPFDLNSEPNFYRMTVKNFVAASGKYCALPWPEAPMVLFRATKGNPTLNDLSWSLLVQNLRIVEVDSEHATLTRLDPAVAQIVDEIRFGILESK